MLARIRGAVLEGQTLGGAGVLRPRSPISTARLWRPGGIRKIAGVLNKLADHVESREAIGRNSPPVAMIYPQW